MASGLEKRVWCCAKFGEVLLIGEKLRTQMHSADDPTLIKDRRYFMKSYDCCFIGNETVDWLCKCGHVPNRQMGVAVMNVLLDNRIVSAVSGSSSFGDDSSLYRFKKDDSSYPWNEDLAVLMKGKRLHDKLRSEPSPLVKRQEEAGVMYKRAFVGRALVDWMVVNQEAISRAEAVIEGKLLLQNEVIRHVTDSQHFKDEDNLLYQFKINFDRDLCLLDLVIPPENESDDDVDSQQDESSQESRDSLDGSMLARIRSSNNSLSAHRDVPTRSESGYHSDLHGSSPGSPPGTGFPQLGTSSSLEDTLHGRVTALKIDSPSGVLIRKASIEQLTAEDSPFIKKHIRVAQDPVGYGIVLRGDGPVFVKAVDPMGPAAKAGLKVGHYLYSINDDVMMTLNYRQVAHRVVDCNGYMNMVVFEHIHDQRQS